MDNKELAVEIFKVLVNMPGNQGISSGPACWELLNRINTNYKPTHNWNSKRRSAAAQHIALVAPQLYEHLLPFITPSK